jgi:hypothetical protein
MQTAAAVKQHCENRRRLTNWLERLGQDGREGLSELVHVGGDLVVAVLDLVIAYFVRLVEYHVALSHVVVVAPPSHFFTHLQSCGYIISQVSYFATAYLFPQLYNVVFEQSVENSKTNRRTAKLGHQFLELSKVSSDHRLYNLAPMTRDPHRAKRSQKKTEGQHRNGIQLTIAARLPENCGESWEDPVCNGLALLDVLFCLVGLHKFIEFGDEQ